MQFGEKGLPGTLMGISIPVSILMGLLGGVIGMVLTFLFFVVLAIASWVANIHYQGLTVFGSSGDDEYSFVDENHIPFDYYGFQKIPGLTAEDIARENQIEWAYRHIPISKLLDYSGQYQPVINDRANGIIYRQIFHIEKDSLGFPERTLVLKRKFAQCDRNSPKPYLTWRHCR